MLTRPLSWTSLFVCFVAWLYHMTVVDTTTSYSAGKESKVSQQAQKALRPDRLSRDRQDYSFPGSRWLLPVAFFTTRRSPQGFLVCFMKVFYLETQVRSDSHMGLCTLYPALGQTNTGQQPISVPRNGGLGSVFPPYLLCLHLQCSDLC